MPRWFLFLSTFLLLYKTIFFLAFFTSPCASYSYCCLFLTTLVFMALGSATHSLTPMTDTLLRGNKFSSDDELPMSPRVLLKRLHINYWKYINIPRRSGGSLASWALYSIPWFLPQFVVTSQRLVLVVWFCSSLMPSVSTFRKFLYNPLVHVKHRRCVNLFASCCFSLPSAFPTWQET